MPEKEIKLESAIHPTLGEVKIGDIVLSYRGRFGHSVVSQIASIWDFGDWIGFSDDKTPPCYDIQEIKQIFTRKEYKKICRIIEAASRYEDYEFINNID